jgi:hypothetical protein
VQCTCVSSPLVLVPPQRTTSISRIFPTQSDCSGKHTTSTSSSPRSCRTGPIEEGPARPQPVEGVTPGLTRTMSAKKSCHHLHPQHKQTLRNPAAVRERSKHRTHTHTHAHARTRTHTQAHTHTHTSTHAHTHTHASTHTHTHTHTHRTSNFYAALAACSCERTGTEGAACITHKLQNRSLRARDGRT